MKCDLDVLLEELPVLTDGAWGTELQARGLALGEFPDSWNLARPERVLEVARSYVEAGSRIILTNTFGSNAVRLAGSPLEGQAKELNRAGVQISKQAATGRAWVFASIGPSGKLMWNGDVTTAELRSAFSEQAEALAQAGADGLVIETMSDIKEAKVAVHAAKATGLVVIGCMVFDSGKNRDRTMMGVTPEQAAQELLEAGADLVGANCGQGIESFAPICERLKAVGGKPVWMKPNAGLPEWIEGRPAYRAVPGRFAEKAADLVEMGAGFVGGCCGTNPHFIRALAAALDARTQPRPSGGVAR